MREVSASADTNDQGKKQALELVTMAGGSNDVPVYTEYWLTRNRTSLPESGSHPHQLQRVHKQSPASGIEGMLHMPSDPRVGHE